MNFIKKLKENRCVRLILDSDCRLFSKHKQNLVKGKNILKDYIDEKESAIELEGAFLYYIENFREKTLKEKTGDVEIIPFIICYSKGLYKVRSELEKNYAIII